MRDAYLQPYRDAQSEHGSGFDVTLWARPETQRLRFEVFCQMLDFRGKAVLDAGCSRGDFAAYLNETDVGYRRFVGIDGLEDVVAFARGRGLPDSRFEAGDFVRDPGLLATDSPEIVCFSGTLNTMDPGTATSVLDGAWAAAGEAVIFNFLSDRAGPGAPPQEYPARRLPLMSLLDWALAQTPSVRMRQDYFAHGHDATLLMSKM